MKSYNTKDCFLNPKRSAITNTVPSSNKHNEENRALIISETKSGSLKAIDIKGIIKNKRSEFIVDSGSDFNYAHEKVLKVMNLNYEETNPITLIFGGGKKETTNTKITVDISFNTVKYTVEFYVLKELPVSFILGNEFLINNNCGIKYGKRTFSIGTDNVMKLEGCNKSTDEILDERLSENVCLSIIQDYPDLNKILKYYMEQNNLFSSIRASPAQFITKNSLAIIQSRGYAVPYKFLHQGQEEIQRLLRENIIKPSNSPFTSPAFFLRKKNNDLRLVIDYKKINNMLEDDPWILPKIDECLMEMRTIDFFSQLDFQNGFNQIKIAEDCQKHTAFILLGKQYEYKRIPFGIKPGPKIFQRYISEILESMRNCFVS